MSVSDVIQPIKCCYHSQHQNAANSLPRCFLRHHLATFAKMQGPVVQSIVNLTSWLRGQLFKCLTTLQPNTLIFFVEKMTEAFASHVFSTKNTGIFEILTFEILTKH